MFETYGIIWIWVVLGLLVLKGVIVLTYMLWRRQRLERLMRAGLVQPAPAPMRAGTRVITTSGLPPSTSYGQPPNYNATYWSPKAAPSAPPSYQEVVTSHSAQHQAPPPNYSAKP